MCYGCSVQTSSGVKPANKRLNVSDSDKLGCCKFHFPHIHKILERTPSLDVRDGAKLWHFYPQSFTSSSCLTVRFQAILYTSNIQIYINFFVLVSNFIWLISYPMKVKAKYIGTAVMLFCTLQHIALTKVAFFLISIVYQFRSLYQLALVSLPCHYLTLPSLCYCWL
jgi:hypothetical protein